MNSCGYFPFPSLHTVARTLVRCSRGGGQQTNVQLGPGWCAPLTPGRAPDHRPSGSRPPPHPQSPVRLPRGPAAPDQRRPDVAPAWLRLPARHTPTQMWVITSQTLARHQAEVGHNKICCYHPSSGTPGLLASGIMLDAPPAVSHCPACTQALNKCHWRLNHIVEQQIKPSLSPRRTASRLSHHCHPGEQRAICPPKPFYDHSFPCKLLSFKVIKSVFHIGVIITLFMDIIERHI